MKKTISIIALLFGLSFLTSCESTVTMDGSADARVDAVIKGYISELAAAENGWIFDVMTSEGNYRFYMEFTDDNMVTMYTDNLYYPQWNGVPKTSTYNIRSLQRPTLSFDTYSYLAVINDPDDGISHGSGNMGLQTDFEFEVETFTDGVFSLTGRVNRVAATLRQATAEESASVKSGGLMDVLTNAQRYRSGEYCYFMVGDTKVSLILNARSIDISYVDAEGNVIQSSGYTLTDLEGNISLLEPIEVAGETLTGFAWDASASAFEAEVAGTPQTVDAQADPVIPLHYMLGPNKTYTVLASMLDMYPSYSASENEFAYLFVQAYTSIAQRYRLQLQELDLEFYMTDGGAPRMMMVYDCSGYQGWVTYSLSFNETEDQFTVTGMSFDDDAYGNGALFASAYTALPLFWSGKTFKIDWSPVTYGSYSMGQVVLVDGDAPAAFHGALF